MGRRFESLARNPIQIYLKSLDINDDLLLQVAWRERVREAREERGKEDCIDF